MKQYEVQSYKDAYPPGTKVELVYMDDARAIAPGTKGEVVFVDDIGTIHVNWENGRRLGVCPDVDSIRKVQEVPEKKPSVAEKLKAAEKQAASTPKADKPAPNKSNQER